MQENAGYFRSTAFGGFHRQDVLDHIEAMNRTHREELEQAEKARADLTAQLDEARAACEEADQRFTTQLDEAEQAHQQTEQRLTDQLVEERQARQTAQEQLESITQEARKAQQEVTQYKTQAELSKAQEQRAEAEAEKLRAQLERVNQELEDIRAEREQLRRQVDSLVPGAAAWQRIRDTAGEIEVSAHERAQVTIQQAQDQAAAIQAEGLRRVQEIQASCDKLQEQLQASIKAAEAELNTIHTAFANTEHCVDTIQKSLAGILGETDEADVCDSCEEKLVPEDEAVQAVEGEQESEESLSPTA